MWDCCGGFIFIEEMDNEEYGLIVEFWIGVELIVMGFIMCFEFGGGDILFDVIVFIDGGLL